MCLERSNSENQKIRHLVPSFLMAVLFALPLWAGVNLHESMVVAETHREGDRLVASLEKVVTENGTAARVWLAHYSGTEMSWSLPIDFEGKAIVDQIATHFDGSIWLLGRTGPSNGKVDPWNHVFLMKVTPDGQMASALMFAIYHPARPSISIDALGDVRLNLFRDSADLVGFLYKIHIASEGHIIEVGRLGFRASALTRFSDQPLVGLEERIVTRSGIRMGSIIQLETLFSHEQSDEHPEHSLNLEQIGIPIDPEPSIPDPDAPPPQP